MSRNEIRRDALTDDRTQLTISDRAQALMVLDQERIKIASRKSEIYAELEGLRIRDDVLYAAIVSIQKDGLYTMESL